MMGEIDLSSLPTEVQAAIEVGASYRPVRWEWDEEVFRLVEVELDEDG